MRNDFIPIHLKQANAALDNHILSPKSDSKDHNMHKDKSLWQRFLGLLK